MEARKVGAAHGWMWLKQGFWLFKKNPLLWMVQTAIVVVGMFGIAIIPIVGDPLSALLFPSFFAGLMLGCHALAKEEELELAHLFAGFQRYAAPLVALGGINLIGNFLILGMMMLTGGASLVGIMMSGNPPDNPEVFMQAVTEAWFALPLGVALSFALQATTLFATMLVIFRSVAPIPALQASLRAFLRNAMPLIVYGLMQLPFAVLATLPMMLGWLVLLPILITSMYAVYRDMFPMESDLAASSANMEAAPPGDQPPTTS